MSLAIAIKPSSDHLNKKKHDTTYEALRGFHTVYSNSHIPAIQLKPICPCGGGCPRCAPVIQPKLTISQSNDIYEQEADRVAEQVMRMPENTSVSRQLSMVRKENESVQRKHT